MSGQEPVFRFRDEFDPESWWPKEYVSEALPVLDGFGWLIRPATQDDQDAAAAVLDGLDGLSLDESDVYPFGLLWVLRARGVLAAVAGLDEQLTAWRKWEEEDHLATPDVGPDPLGFLPALIPDDAWGEMVMRHERERADLELRQADEMFAMAEQLGYAGQADGWKRKAEALRARSDGAA